jgi:HlyD family secretion protein
MPNSRQILIVLLTSAILLTGCQGLFGRPIEEEAPTPTPIPTPIVPDKPIYVVQRGKITKQFEFTGRISAVEEMELYFKASGYVKRVLVKRDDQVQAGDLLAELEIDDLLKQMAQAEVTLNSAQLRLNEAEKSLEQQIAQAELDLDTAEAQSTQAENNNAAAIAQAERDLATAQAQLTQAESDNTAAIAQAELDLTVAEAQLTQTQNANADAIAQAEWTLQIAQANLEEAKKANERQLAEAQRALEVAQIRLAQLQEEPDAAEIELLRLSWERAKNNLWSAQLERDAVKGNAKASGYLQKQADIAVSNAEIAVRETELRYQQALQTAVTEDDIRLQQIEVERAKVTLEQLQEGVDPLLTIEVQRAQQKLDELKEDVDPLLGIEVQQAQQKLSRLKEGVDPLLGLRVQWAQQTLDSLKEEGVDPLLAIQLQRAQQQLEWLKEGVDPVMVNEVNQAQLALERLQAQVADAQIVAPIDGQILSLSAYAGRPAEAFKPVIVVADPSAIEVSADLSSSQLKDMVEGQKAVVTLRAYPGQTWNGTVRRLPYPYGTGGGSEALASEDKSTRISLEGDLSDLQLGDLARVIIVLEEKDDVLWLSPAAIRTFQGREFVIVQDADRQRRVDVTIGIESDDRVEILEGLEEGQIVVGQ